MTTRNAPEGEPELFLDEADEEGQGARARRPPDRVPASVRFSHLTHYATDGRTDAQAAMTLVTTTPYTDDQELQRRAIRGATDLRGMFFRETRNKSQGFLRRDTIDVVSETRTATAQAAPAVVPLSPVSQAETPAHAVNSVTDAVRAVRDLTKELAPPSSQGAPLSRDDVQNMIRDTVREIVEQLKPVSSVAPTVDPFEVLERAMKLQTDIQKQVAANNPTPTPPQQGDEFERVLSLMDRVQQVRERIEPPRSMDEESSMWGKASALIDTIGRNAPSLAPLVGSVGSMVAPLLPARVQALIAGVSADDTAAPAEAQPQAAGTPASAQAKNAPQNEQEALAVILHVAVNEMIRNKRVGRTADLVEQYCRSFPTMNATVDQLCALSPEEALATVQQLAGRSDLTSLSHSVAWVESLQDELRQESAPDVEQPAVDNSIIDMARARAL